MADSISGLAYWASDGVCLNPTVSQRFHKPDRAGRSQAQLGAWEHAEADPLSGCLRSQDNHGQRSVVDTLLFGKTFVHGNKHVEALGHRIKKRPVIEISPTHFRCRSNFVRRQFTG
jgi:hypothetical protein